MDIFYVYCYFDGETPIYIGKGSRGRIREHLASSSLDSSDTFFSRKLRKILREDRQPTYRKLLQGLLEEEAFYYERFFIAAIGRRVDGTGPLCNMTWGGDYSNTGYRHSKERKEKIGKVSVNKWRDPVVRKRMLDGMHKPRPIRTRSEEHCTQMSERAAAHSKEQIRRLRAGSISWVANRQRWFVSHGIYIGMRDTYVEAERLRVDYCKAVRDGWEARFLEEERERNRIRIQERIAIREQALQAKWDARAAVRIKKQKLQEEEKKRRAEVRRPLGITWDKRRQMWSVAFKNVYLGRRHSYNDALALRLGAVDATDLDVYKTAAREAYYKQRHAEGQGQGTPRPINCAE